MAANLLDDLTRLEHAASRLGLNRGRWAERSGLRAETLSRLFTRDDCDLRTLANLAGAVNHRLLLVPQPHREMPAHWNRDLERKYALLCASGSTDLGRWLRAGPRYFLSGLAMMMGSSRGADREACLALAFALCPAMQDASEFETWLSMTPTRPSRFLPMVRALKPVTQ
jgi:hypothetical protein